MTQDQMRAEFEAWVESYALIYEPNYNKQTHADCFAAWQAARASAHECITDMQELIHELRLDRDIWKARASAPQGVPQHLDRADMAFIMDELPVSAIRARGILRSAILSSHDGLGAAAQEPPTPKAQT